MSLENLCRQIEHNSKARAGKIADDASLEAEKLISDAHSSSRKLMADAQKQAEEFSALEAGERINAAEIEAQKMLTDAQDAAAQECLAQVWDHFSQARKSAGYSKKLRRWAEIALSELDMGGAVLRCAAEDRQILSSAGFKVSNQPIETFGGVRAESRDGKIIVDYTLEAQFEQKKEEILRQIYSSLFGAEGNAEKSEPEKKSPVQKTAKKGKRKGRKK